MNNVIEGYRARSIVHGKARSVVCGKAVPICLHRRKIIPISEGKYNTCSSAPKFFAKKRILLLFGRIIVNKVGRIRGVGI